MQDNSNEPLHSNITERPLPGSPKRELELSIVVPTMNERANIQPFLQGLEAALGDVFWEVVFVDDNSPDLTAQLVREIARRDRRVRCVQRIGRRGLSSACVEGMLAGAGPVIAVMDADMQHDERLLPKMLDALHQSGLDIVVGSRYVEGGGVGTWGKGRQLVSQGATWLSRAVIRAELKDPMSGFFMLRREAFEAAVGNLSQQGFKILVDLFASSPRPLRFQELPYQFRERQFGESKLDATVMWEYLRLLLDKTLGRFVPVRFVMFVGVGGVGAAVHFSILWLVFGILAFGFEVAQATATGSAMIFNFLVNNAFTYRDQRLRGLQLLRGLATFMVVCGLGAIANVGVGSYVFRANEIWWLAGLAGALVSAVWNYGVSSMYTWRRQ